MNGTLSSDWLLQQAIWAHSASSRFPAKVAQEKVAILTSGGVASFSTGSIMDKSPWYCIIHIFLSFLGSLIKQCTLFEIFLQFSLPPPYTKLKLGKNSGYTRPTLFAGWGEGLDLCELENVPEMQSVPRLLSRIVVVGLADFHFHRSWKLHAWQVLTYIHTYIHTLLLPPKGAVQEQWLYYIIYNN